MPSSGATTQRALALKPHFDEGLEIAWPLTRAFQKKFKAEHITGSEDQFLVKTRQSASTARGRAVGGNHAGEIRNYGTATAQLAPGYVRPRVLQSRYYRGVTLDGPINAMAADKAGSWEQFSADVVDDITMGIQNALEEDLLHGDGTGILAYIDDQQQATATLRVKRNTAYADRGMPGARFLQEEGMYVFVEIQTGIPAADANGNVGYMAQSIDWNVHVDYSEVLLDRTVPTAVSTNPERYAVVEGDNDGNSYNEAIVGFDAVFNDAAGYPLLWEVDRTIARGYSSTVVDATTGASWGDVTMNVIGRILHAIKDGVGMEPDRGTGASDEYIAVSHDTVRDELLQGAQASGGTYTGLAGGIVSLLRFKRGEDLEVDLTKVKIGTSSGAVVLEGHTKAIFNTLFIIKPSLGRWISWNKTAGVPEFMPGVGQGGIWTKRDARDQYDATGYWYGQYYYKNPRKAGRADALRQAEAILG